MIQATHCEKCGGDYMVGFLGKDVRKRELSGGHFGDTPYVEIGHGEIDDCPAIKKGDKIPCPGCGAEVIVEDTGCGAEIIVENMKPVER
jgi:hypothetical protein